MNHLFTEYQPYFFAGLGVLFLLVSAFVKSKKNGLKETGIAAEGIVYDQEHDLSVSLSTDADSSAKNKVTVRFVTQKEEWITGIINQDFQTYYTGQYKNGDTVTVYYDKDNPSDFYVDTGQSKNTGRVVIGLTGLVFTLCGLYKLFL